MSIKVSAKSGGGNFTPHPEGQFVAVCCDVHDVGMKETVWNGNRRMVHKVDLYFYCGEWKELQDGTQIPLLVRERFTASLGDKAKLTPFVEKMHGLTKAQRDGEADFDLDSLIGCGALIEVVHRESDGQTYANIDSIMKLPKGTNAPEIPADYKRVKDRPPREERNADSPMDRAAYANRRDQRQAAASAPQRGPSTPAPFDPDDDELPF